MHLPEVREARSAIDWFCADWQVYFLCTLLIQDWAMSGMRLRHGLNLSLMTVHKWAPEQP